MHHLPDGPQVFTSYTISGDVSPPWCKCIVCRACVQPVNRSWLHACLQSASFWVSFMYFPSALCLRSGSAEGFTVPAVLGWRWGYTQDVYFVRSWGQTKKWKKMPRTFLKNNPCDLTMKKNKKTTTAKRNIQCQSPKARQTWRLWNMKFKVRTLKLQFQAQKLGNYNFIYIYFHVQKSDMLTNGLVWRALSARPSKTFHETRCQEVWNAAHGHARYGCQARFVSQWPLKIAIPVWLVDVTSHHVTQHRAPYSLRQVMSHNGTLGTNMAMGFLFLLLNPIPV